MDDIEKYNKTGYIAAIARGHNAGVCLLKDGEVVFSIEEERLSKMRLIKSYQSEKLKVDRLSEKNFEALEKENKLADLLK